MSGKSLKGRYKIALSKEFLIEEYITKGKTTTQIGNEIGCSWSTIRIRLFRYNIPVRKPISGKELAKNYGHSTRFKNGHKNTTPIKPLIKNPEKLSPTELQIILDGNITKRMAYKQWANKIINERSNRCEICLKNQSEIKSKLFLHHIKPRKTHPELCFDENNVMVICRVCHPKIEYTGKKIHER